MSVQDYSHFPPMDAQELHLTGKTQYDYWIKRYNADTSRHKITPASVRTYIDRQRARRLKPATVKLIKCALVAGFRATYTHIRDRSFWQAVEWDFRQIKTPRPHRQLGPDAFLTESEIRTILENSDSRTAAIIWLFAKTGARLAELASLRLTDCRPGTIFDETTGKRRAVMHMTIHGKGNKDRIVSINRQDFRRIKTAMGSRDYLLTNQMGRRYCLRRLQTIVTEAGAIVDMRTNVHKFRHSFATNQLKRGATIGELASYLGHSSPRITAEYYLHGSMPVHLLDSYLMPPQASLRRKKPTNEDSKNASNMAQHTQRRESKKANQQGASPDRRSRTKARRVS